MHFFASSGGSGNHGNSYLVYQSDTSLIVYESVTNTLNQLGSATLAAANGETHTYKAIYNPTGGGIAVWRDGTFVLTVTDPTPLTSGSYVALRTYNGKVSYDNVRITGVNATFSTLTYLYGDHLGSAAVLADTSGQLVDRVRFYPFGGYRGSDSSLQTDRGFTGHRQNDDLGLVYMNARYYVQGIGRFASADTIVPDPKNPQSYNRYSYVRNNPIMLIDPSGHREVCGESIESGCGGNDPDSCDASSGSDCGMSSSGNDSQATTTSDDEYLFTDTPIEDPTWANGFGANTFAQQNATNLYTRTSGLHGGIDLAAPSGTSVFTRTTGTVVDINYGSDEGDAVPNIVIKVGDYFITFGHTVATAGLKVGDEVGPDDVIGTLADQGDNSHLHLVVRDADDRVHNPLNFFDPADVEAITWSSYPEGESPYSISSFLYTNINYWDNPNDASIGVIRP